MILHPMSTPPVQRETKIIPSPPLYLLPPPPPPLPPPPPRLTQAAHTSKRAWEPIFKSRRGGRWKKAKAVLLPPPRRTNPLVWLAAFLCAIFSLLLILAGVAILIIFLVIKPRYPLFDTTTASLSSIYLDTPEYLNGDLTFFANFSNPNRKMSMRFEYLSIDLFFSDRLISTKGIEPFRLRREATRVEAVHMISSEVYLPLNLSTVLQKQVLSNRVGYNIRGTFRVRAELGVGHFSYWLRCRCQIQMSSPPNGILLAHTCKTRR